MKAAQPVRTAQIDWQSRSAGLAVPCSPVFDDVYFSGNGPDETRHVFLRGNALASRMASSLRFTVGELGFGTALNFLCTWHLWDRLPKKDAARLYYFAVERYPLAAGDMAAAHDCWPELEAYARALRAVLPPVHPGFHAVSPARNVSLLLCYGDVYDVLCKAQAGVDAWFADGFSPDRNPAMWSSAVFAEVARLSAETATVATFSVAGCVRRSLQGAGFVTEKKPGFGRKRHMLTGKISSGKTVRNHLRPWFDVEDPQTYAPGAEVAVIGGGIAGASMAHALAGAGLSPVVYEMDRPGAGASGNRAGLVMPRPDAGNTPAGRFHTEAFLYTTGLLERYGMSGHEHLFSPCGVVMHARSGQDRKRMDRLLSGMLLPENLVKAHSCGLFFPGSGVVSPGDMVCALLEDVPLRNEKVTGLAQCSDMWVVRTTRSARKFDAVVIANAFHALEFGFVSGIPFAASAGQVDFFRHAPSLSAAHVFGRYVVPVRGGGVMAGSTYASHTDGTSAGPSSENTLSNLDAVRKMFSQYARLKPEESEGRTGIRCVTPDRLPVIGRVPEREYYRDAYEGLRTGKKMQYPPGRVHRGLYILSGLGSRGLVTAPYGAAIITAQMTGTPVPADRDVIEAVHPARFLVRNLRRNRVVR